MSATNHTEHVDVLVVGSGFGGAVTAFRMAEANRSVVLLERGRPYPPGSFPRSPHEMGRAFWAPDEGLHGLFDVWSFSGFESVVSAGLGGGSLIYANVLLRKDERWFVHSEAMPGGGYETWPVTRADLDPHYDAVEKMLAPAPYPLGHPEFADTPKTHALRDVASRLDLDWHLPPLAVRFASTHGGEPGVGLPIEPEPYGNVHGVPRRTCRLVGECDVGCNEGAKNTLDHTYLSAAAHHGADIRTLCEVLGVRPLSDGGTGGGYRVDYVVHHPDDPDAAPSPRVITADRVILGAGTYGSTYLLLRNRASLPGLSERLGTRFCGNGDVLSFLLPGGAERAFRASHGPVITGAIRVGDGLDEGVDDADARGFYLEDGGYPGFVDWLVQPVESGQSSRTAWFLLDWLARRVWPRGDARIGDEVARLIGDGALSVGSLPLLGMGRDVPDGVLRLRDGLLAAQQSEATSASYYERVRKTMTAIAGELGTEYRDDPLWFFRRVVTVHPLGGAPMGHGPADGVCDAHGEVFGHPGLYVADGAALPGPVGANPSLTIAAHADRVATRILESPERPRHGRAAAAPPEPSGLSFTEEMRGHVTVGHRDPVAGEEAGRARGHGATLHLTITIDDVERFLDRSDHRAAITGRVVLECLGGPVALRGGSFNLFVAGDGPGARRMLYRLFLADDAGVEWTLVGRKEVRDDPGFDVWSDTTTLYVRLLHGHVDEGDDAGARVAGAGIARIGELDLLRQLTTFTTTGPDGPRTLLRFGRFFLGQLWEVYGT